MARLQQQGATFIEKLYGSQVGTILVVVNNYLPHSNVIRHENVSQAVVERAWYLGSVAVTENKIMAI